MNIGDNYRKFKKLFLNLISEFFTIRGSLITLSYTLIFVFLITLLSNIINEIFLPNPNYQYIISFGINGTIVSATLALLTFTYALVLDYPIRRDIISIGKIFLRSTLFFIIGIISLNVVKEMMDNSEKFASPDLMAEFTVIFLFFGGFLLLILSASLFAVGISKLLFKII